MPAESKGHVKGSAHQNRRASLPYNLKIPAITITPSSPSPDPNHPDYPEFFEDRLYLETLSKCSGSGDSPTGMEIDDGGDRAEELSALPSSQHSEKEADLSLEICYENVQAKRVCRKKSTGALPPEVVELSSDPEDEMDEDDEDMESTPEFDIVLARAGSDLERTNCLNYAKGLKKRKDRQAAAAEGMGET
jgi:hypothetical protein